MTTEQQRQQAIDTQARQTLTVGDQHARSVSLRSGEALLAWVRANLGPDDLRQMQRRLNSPTTAAGEFTSQAEFLASARERRLDHYQRLAKTPIEVIGGGVRPQEHHR